MSRFGRDYDGDVAVWDKTPSTAKFHRRRLPLGTAHVFLIRAVAEPQLPLWCLAPVETECI